VHSRAFVALCRSWRVGLAGTLAVGSGVLGSCGTLGSPAGASGPLGPHVALLGDSVLSDMARDIRTTGFGTHPDTRAWTIDGQTGSGWGATEDASGQWPLDVVEGGWAVTRVRALGESHPAAIVLELGTNDALRGAFALATSDPHTLAARRTGTDDNIRAVITAASALTPCVIVVTPSAYPTPLFRAEDLYASEAARLAGVLRLQASSAAQPPVLIADWLAESATHHLGDGIAANWFATNDEIHPNLSGEQALAELIASTVARCPKSA
jgi:lysophospholipase L1-like esterase